MQSETLKNIERLKREALKGLLARVTEKQQKLFYRLYPAGPDKMPAEKLDWAIVQCENTIKKNEQ